MEFAVTHSIPDDSFAGELWISKIPGATGLLLARRSQHGESIAAIKKLDGKKKTCFFNKKVFALSKSFTT